ncbi:unnamed protein product [Toxocara canis]|uniref:Uncharacterized protein n=1 Tax=Toxocara canis TaxID=6265 RepID=A0A183TY91_TOXCA|nr:unnamed protein product [Toxocara canis]
MELRSVHATPTSIAIQRFLRAACSSRHIPHEFLIARRSHGTDLCRILGERNRDAQTLGADNYSFIAWQCIGEN